MTGRRVWRGLAATLGLLAAGVVLAGPASASATGSGRNAAAPNAPTLAPVTATAATAGALEIHFIDVGQGNATLIVAPSGKTLLVDSGEAAAAPRVAAYLDLVLGRRLVDYFVVSHYHADHFGSFVTLLRDYGLKVTTATYDRGGDSSEYNSALYRSYFDYCTVTAPASCQRTTIHEGDGIDLGAGVTASVVCAGDIVIRLACGESIASENDNSILVLVRSGSLAAWIGGDTSGDVDHRYYADVETAAVKLGRVPALDIYGVDHHGSCYSTNDNLVNASAPTVSVFSLGLNSYGHPCDAVVTRLQQAGSKVYSTEDSSGSVIDGDVRVVYTGGNTYTVTSAQGTATFATKV